MTLFEICEWLETTALGSIAPATLYGFQVLVGIHILGLVLSVGMLLWVDLRMMGVAFVDERLSEVYRSLLPWFIFGFSAMLLSGFVLFSGFATSAYENTYFRIKIVAIVLAGINALVFHVVSKKMSGVSGSAQRSPALARFAGLASIIMWGLVVLSGRMMSYTMF